MAASRSAKWGGSTWSALLDGMNGGVYALTVQGDAGGQVLVAGGAFTRVDGQNALRTAQWNGASWSHLGTGIEGTVPSVLALSATDAAGNQSTCQFPLTVQVKARRR